MIILPRLVKENGLDHSIALLNVAVLCNAGEQGLPLLTIAHCLLVPSTCYSSFALSRLSSASAAVSSEAGRVVSSSSAGSSVICAASSVTISALSVGITPAATAGSSSPTLAVGGPTPSRAGAA